jgi:hypothetical protein
MKIRRVISVYSTINDKLIDEFSIDDLPIGILKEILNITNDLDIFKIHLISKEQLIRFSEFIPELTQIKMDKIELYVECFQD